MRRPSVLQRKGCRVVTVLQLSCVVVIVSYLLFFDVASPHLADHSLPQELRDPQARQPHDKRDVCYAMTAAHMKRTNLHPYGFNARIFCVKRTPTCHAYRALYRTLNTDVSCSAVDAAYRTVVPKPNCTALQRRVNCHHATFDHLFTFNDKSSECRAQMSLSAMPRNATWLDGPAVVLPPFLYLGNIFHFSTVASYIAQTVDNLPALLGSSRPHNVHIIFRGGSGLKETPWNRFVFEALLQKMRAKGVTPFVHFLKQGPSSAAPLCAQESVMMGLHASVNQWAFPTGARPRRYHSVPVEALEFRQLLYKKAGAPTRLPARITRSRATVLPKKAWSDLPSLAIGYASRQDWPIRDQHGNWTVENSRRLSDVDDRWLRAMVSEEAERVGAIVRTVPISHQLPAEQVRMFRQIGVVLGVHGANLVNAMFMPAFSAMVEISLNRIECYQAGSNSGINSWRFVTTRKATAEQSLCNRNPVNWKRERCINGTNDRMVLIDDKESRDKVRSLVRRALDYVKAIRDAFGHLGAVPIVYDENLAEYRIDMSLTHSIIGPPPSDDEMIGNKVPQ